MAKSYLIAGFVIDPNGWQDIKMLLEDTFGRNSCILQHLTIEESKPYEWSDDLPENREGCTTKELLQRFTLKGDHDV